MSLDDAVDARTRHWGEVYAERGEQGVSWFTPQPVVSLDLLDAAGIGPAASVIDVGAGASRLVDALLDRGHTDLTVLDITEGGLAIARSRVGPAAARVQWVVADLLTWEPRRHYDVWHDRAVFHFLTAAAEQARYVQLLDRALDPGGVVVVGTFAEDGPQACSGLPTARYGPEELLDVLGGPGRWTELARRRRHHTTPWGVDQAFTWLALRRR